jgi:hypothetical protein
VESSEEDDDQPVAAVKKKRKWKRHLKKGHVCAEPTDEEES